MVETIPIWRPPFWQLLWRGLAWLYALAARRTEAPGCGADEARATPALRNAETALDRYGDSILRLAYSYLHNLSDAEDILQDTLLKYIQAAPAFESDGHEKAWLLTVAANLSKNKLQYLRLRQTDELDETLAAQEREDLRYVWEAVRQLPGNYREVIHLFYQEGYSTKEISTILRRSKLYVCPVCGNIIHSMGSVPVSSGGIGLPPLEPEEPDADHAVTWKRIENEFYGNTAQFGKKPQPGFLAQFKVWKTKEYCMYPQGVCRIRKPAYAGNGCAIFLVFQTEEVGQKGGCGSQTQLRGVALVFY